MTLLSDQEILRRLADSEWERDGQAIVREWKLADFAAAIVFAFILDTVKLALFHRLAIT